MVNIMGLRPDVRAKYEEFLQKFPQQNTISAYRDPAYNAGVNGAKRSQHMHGNALDFSVKGMAPEQQQAMLNYWKGQSAQGFGHYGNSVHVDFRDQPAFWGPNKSRTSLPQTPTWFQDFAANKPSPVATPSMASTSAPMPPLRGSMGVDQPMTGARPATPPARPQTGLLSFDINGPVNSQPSPFGEVAPGVPARNPMAQNGMQMAPNMQGFQAPQNPITAAPEPAPAPASDFNWNGALSAGLGALGKWATSMSQPQPTMQAPQITNAQAHRPQVDPSQMMALLNRKRTGLLG